MEWGLFIAFAGLVITIGGGFAAYGKLSNKVENLEKALNDEIRKNSEQHKDFYDVQKTSIKMETELTGIGKRLESVEDGIKEILMRLPAHRREGESV